MVRARETCTRKCLIYLNHCDAFGEKWRNIDTLADLISTENRSERIEIRLIAIIEFVQRFMAEQIHTFLYQSPFFLINYNIFCLM